MRCAGAGRPQRRRRGRPAPCPRQERGAWSAEELRAFLEATSEGCLAAMWLLFAPTGMRRSELLGLPWRAVDLEASPGRFAVVQTIVVLDRQPVVVAEAKTATSRRQLALDPFTTAALKAHRVRQLQERLAWGPAWVETGLVFTARTARSCTPSTSPSGSPAWCRMPACRRPPCTASGTAMRPRRWPPASRSRSSPSGSGHASTSITANLYQHVLPSRDERTATAVANLILGNREPDTESSAVNRTASP
jgi:integrase